MLHTFGHMKGFTIGATDDELGQVDDLLFDDQRWQVSYLAGSTGSWLPGRRVVISPAAVRSVDWTRHVILVDLTREEIEDSPPIEDNKPVSRQKAEAVSEYFGWPAFWSPPAPGAGPRFMGAASVPEPDTDRVEASDNRGDPHLRSATEVINYHVVTTDGEMGHIEDFAIDAEAWALRYAVIDTINWWPSKKVILSPEWIREVKWDNRAVHFDLSKEVIKNAPEYDTSQPIHREYEVRIHDYYGQPHYWTQPSTAANQHE